MTDYDRPGRPTNEERDDWAKNRLKEVLAEKIELQQENLLYRDLNLLEFFDVPPSPGPNPKQAQVLEAFTDNYFKTFGMSGGNRLGKTTLLTIIGISVMIGKYLWNNQSLLHLFPHNKPRKIRYIGQGWQDHIKAVVIPELDKWWPRNRKLETHGNGIITDTFWKDIESGSTLEIMSNNQRVKEHEGWSGDLILYDEPCKREIYTANARGLVDRQGREAFAATLLDEPWIDRDIVKKKDADGRPDRTVFWVDGKSWDNVGYGITKEGVEQFANKLSDAERKVRIDGVPEYLEGIIYSKFNRKTHLRERFTVPLDWVVDIAIDVHPREKQAVLFVATDPKNERYAIEEIWDNGDGTWIGEEIIRVINNNSYRINNIVIDPLSKGDGNNDETVYQKVFDVLARYDYILTTATKDLKSGILAVKKHLKGPNQQPSLFFFDDLIRTLYEIEGYMWDKKTQKPVDKDDHMMENLYRICLLNTKYVEPGNEEWTNVTENQTRNSDTGY